jgi:maltose O-acetyltransferase
VAKKKSVIAGLKFLYQVLMHFFNNIKFYHRKSILFFRELKNYEFRRGVLFYIINKFKFNEIGYPIYIYKRAYIKNKKKIIFGKNITLCYNCFVSPVSLVVGDNVWLGANNFICGNVKIGNFVSLGPNINIPGAGHIIDSEEPILTSGSTLKGTIIEDYVWIGGNSSIIDGITIHKGAVVGAGSVVTKDVPEYAIVAGVPAKILGYRPAIKE